MSDQDKESLSPVKPFLPKELIPFIHDAESIGSLEWNPQYYEWIKAREHNKMLNLLSKGDASSITNDLLTVYKVSFSKPDLYLLVLYIYSPFDLWEDDALILVDKYPL